MLLLRKKAYQQVSRYSQQSNRVLAVAPILFIVLSIFFYNSTSSVPDTDILTSKQNSNKPTLKIKTTYLIEGGGEHESLLSKNQSFFDYCNDSVLHAVGYDCKKLIEINNEVNKILGQVGIELVKPDSVITPVSAMKIPMPSNAFLHLRVGKIKTGVNPKKYRDKLNEFQTFVEGLFLSQANTVALYSKRYELKETHAEMFVNIVKSVDVGGNKSLRGLYIPKTYRKVYTNSKIRIKDSRYKDNSVQDLIIVGYDDLLSTEKIATAIAHEIGHAFGLCDEFENNDNLMSVENGKGTKLTPEQGLQLQSGLEYFKKYGKTNNKDILGCTKDFNFN